MSSDPTVMEKQARSPACCEKKEATRFAVSVESTLKRLIDETGFSTSDQCDIHTLRQRWESLGPDFCFQVSSLDKEPLSLRDPYHKAVFFQMLKKAEYSGQKEVFVHEKEICENPIRRLSKLIKTYWHGLTRRIDRDHLEQILSDTKASSESVQYLYVPYRDEEGYAYFSKMESTCRGRLKVERLPEEVTAEYVKSIEDRHGLLSLAVEKDASGEYRGVPFVVPGGRFNEMYGWDSYFILKGLLVDGEIEIAKAIVDNFVYQIEHYGKILNANRTYYLTRSQPPFLTSMIREVYAHLEKSPTTKKWLRKALKAAIKEYYEVWMGPERRMETGLSRYFGCSIGPSPEVEPGHFDHVYAAFAEKEGIEPKLFEKRYLEGSLAVPELDEFFNLHDPALRESGHDTTFRWSDRCADFTPVDLNCLLYQIEIDIARILEEEFEEGLEDEKAAKWRQAAEKRKERINTYLWNEEKGLFFDYDLSFGRQEEYESATALFALWAGHDDDLQTRLISPEKAARLVENALSVLEMAGGVAATSERSRGPDRLTRQWEFPNGWAPHQMIIWKGCLQHGFTDVACRLIYRWLYTIAKGARDHNGIVPEKVDVVSRSHEVFACEYGNVGTDFEYLTEEGFGWVNASFQLGLEILNEKAPHLVEALEGFVPPEDIF